jgi:hypothetical protein
LLSVGCRLLGVVVGLPNQLVDGSQQLRSLLVLCCWWRCSSAKVERNHEGAGLRARKRSLREEGKKKEVGRGEDGVYILPLMCENNRSAWTSVKQFPSKHVKFSFVG